ncbi:MAG: hypothetical protein R3257_07945, partial [bacterium]|nr:hypothetical protein [bacterium]
IEKFNPESINPRPPAHSTLAKDLKTYAWFTDGYWARFNEDPLVVADLRYSAWPSKIRPLWGIVLNPKKPQDHIGKIRFDYPIGQALENLWAKIKGSSPGSIQVK